MNQQHKINKQVSLILYRLTQQYEFTEEYLAEELELLHDLIEEADENYTNAPQKKDKEG